MMLFSVAILIALMAGSGVAQDQPPALPKLAAPPAAATATPPAPIILQNQGKPMVLAFQCGNEDIQFAGLACSEDDPCPMYLELASVEAVGDRLLVAGNIHSASVTLFSVLLSSEDLGYTWHEAAERIRGAGLDHVEFLDSQIGWVSGQTLFPLPQDPFLLVTNDGGKTWRERPVFNEARESRYGAVQQFSFTGKDSGSLIVDRGQGSDGDRYELYESPDAGENWAIKETSTKPLHLKRPPAVSTEWRLRTDAATQSFRVEHRQGERWNSVASFAVKLIPCKTPQQ